VSLFSQKGIHDLRLRHRAVRKRATDTASKAPLLGCRNGVIPTNGSITHIGEYAFADVKNLNRIVIPDSVTSIGQQAFFESSNLTRAVIPNSVKTIGAYAFMIAADSAQCNTTAHKKQWNSIAKENGNEESLKHAIYCTDRTIK
jgi:hypothetical protein